MPRASLIISFYNKIDYLKLVFAGLERQTFKDFEIVIADDGSNETIVHQIESLSREIPFPLIHLYQEDKGFRKNKILNKAIVTADSGYLIFIDGDCVPHKDFIKEHYDRREDKACLTGRRVNLSKNITAKLSSEKVKEGWLEKNNYKLFWDSVMGETKDAEKGFYFSNPILQKYFNKKKRGILGCNFSIHKNDMIEINGFDERYEAPSIGEDSDIQFRLELNGVKIKSMNHLAVQYHLYHKPQERLLKNIELFDTVKKSRQAYTPYGIKHQS